MSQSPAGGTPDAPGFRHPLQAGQILDGFKVEGVLAYGGMSTVYRARQLCLGDRPVALKVLATGTQTELRQARFSREARLLSQLHHDRLAEVYGFGETNGLVYYAMRLVEGISLQEFLERLVASRAELERRSYEKVIVRWVIDVADALTVVHRAGLIHRDVKPANVVLEGVRSPLDDLGAARATLVDFGLVRSVEATVHTIAGHGATPSYASPEQLLGSELDAATDVFSLGATLHDLLAIRLGHERPPACQGLAPLSSHVPDVPPDLEAIVAKAADPQRSWRYADAAALLADLQSWIEGRSVTARRPPATERLRRWLASHAKQTARMGAGALIAAILFAAVAMLGGWLQDFRGVAASLRENDLVQAADRIDALPSPLLALLPDDVERPARRLHAADPEDALTSVLDLLRRDDPVSALTVAATQLRMLGAGGDSVMDRLLLARLTGGPEASPESHDLRLTALRLVARVFYERFDHDGTEQASRSFFRDRLVELWDDPLLSRDERLYLVSAMSGVGRGSDVGWLLRWACSQHLLGEEQRLGLSAVQRIALRGVRTNHVDDLALDAAWPVIAPVLREYLEADASETGTPQANSAESLGSAVTALAFAARCAGSPIPAGIRATLCSDDESTACISRIHSSGLWVNGRNEGTWVALGAPCVIRDIVARFESSPDANAARFVGGLLGTADDTAFIDSARTIARHADGQEAATEGVEVALNRGLSEAAAVLQARGQWDRAALDADTYLGYRWPADSELSIDGRSVASDSDRRAPPVAAWSFKTNPAEFSGGATGASLLHGDHLPPQESRATDWFLVFRDFGGSRAGLEFQVDVPPKAALLELVHVSAARAFYPYAGECHVSVDLDGKTVADHVTVITRAYGTESIPLPSILLNRGPHRLTISLESSTTTTYRLLSVRILEPQP